MPMATPQPPNPQRAAPASVPTGPARIPSERLFAGATEVLIEHRGALYRLKLTSLGKLILTK